MRRNLWFLCGIFALLCGGCKTVDRSTVLLRSYVNCYYDVPLRLDAGIDNDECHLFLIFHPSGADGEDAYYSPEIGDWNNDKFLEIAERNGDRGYNQRGNKMVDGSVSAVAHNFTSVEVVCLNAAWDDAHPAKSSLNDLATITYSSYARFIRSGYDNNVTGYYEKPLTELLPDDLAVVDAGMTLILHTLPTAPGGGELSKGYYIFQVTMTTTEGKEFVAMTDLMIK